MDTSQNDPGVPAEWRPMDLGDVLTNYSNTKTFSVPVCHSTLDAGAIVSGAGPSPLPSPQSKPRYLPYQHPLPVPAQWDSFRLDGAQPPTPPHLGEDDGFSPLRQWHAQAAGQQIHTGYTHSPCGATPDGENAREGFQPTSLLHTSITAGYPPRLHPSANLLQSSSPQDQEYRPIAPHPITPPVQQWPTHNLAVDEATRKKQEAYRRRAQARRQSIASQSSSTHSISSIGIPRKRKAGITSTTIPPTPAPPLRHAYPHPNREQHQSYAPLQNSFYQYPPAYFTQPPPQYAPMQYAPTQYASPRYAPIQCAPTQYAGHQYAIQYGHPQHAAPQYTLQPHIAQRDEACNTMDMSGLPLQHLDSRAPQHEQYHPQPPVLDRTRQHAPRVREKPPSPKKPPLSPKLARTLTREEAPQPITNLYGQYKWPVNLYQLKPDSPYPFASLFLEAYLEEHVYRNSRYKWHEHITEGSCIKDGNPHSMLVLHNAASPFTWGAPAEATTTVGVYDSHWQLHWTTFTPNIADLLQHCIDQGFLTLKETWDVDMKPIEKRFHRGYWLAANMRATGRLLIGNIDKRPHMLDKEEKKDDEMGEDEMDDEFEISDDDLQSGWHDGDTVSGETARQVWEDMLQEIEGVDGDLLGSEHIEIGGTERAYDE